jgi:hypothetical protein
MVTKCEGTPSEYVVWVLDIEEETYFDKEKLSYAKYDYFNTVLK